MIARRLYIESYDWELFLYVAVSRYDSDKILRMMEEVDASDRLIDRIRKNLLSGKLNSGFTFSNKRTKQSVMVVGLTSSAKEEFNSISHELRHLTDDIAQTYGIKMCGERVAYLTGDIAERIFPIVSDLLCCRCHQKHNPRPSCSLHQS